MDVLTYFTQNWLGMLSWAVAACVGWLGTHAVGRPILAFEQARASALRALEEHWSVGLSASEARAAEAFKALREVAAALQAYGSGGGPALRLYWAFMRYDMRNAPGIFRGSYSLLVDGHSEDQRRNRNAARVCLGATRGMPREEVRSIRDELRAHGRRQRPT